MGNDDEFTQEEQQAALDLLEGGFDDELSQYCRERRAHFKDRLLDVECVATAVHDLDSTPYDISSVERQNSLLLSKINVRTTGRNQLYAFREHTLSQARSVPGLQVAVFAGFALSGCVVCCVLCYRISDMLCCFYLAASCWGWNLESRIKLHSFGAGRQKERRRRQTAVSHDLHHLTHITIAQSFFMQ